MNEQTNPEDDVTPAEAGDPSPEPKDEKSGPGRSSPREASTRGRDDDAAADPEVVLGETEAEETSADAPADAELDPGGSSPRESVTRGRDDDAEVRADDKPALDIVHVKRVLEAALLSSMEPLTVQQLKRLFGGEVDSDNIRKVLEELRLEWSDRSIELTPVASGWRFRVKPDYQKFLDRITNEKPPRYTRAVLETLAIVAYRQPVTRGDIEEIRGVAVSAPTINALVERGWIETVGHRETPGRPAIFATTRKFLDDLNLRSLEELPPLDELQAALEPAPPSLAESDAAPPPPEQESLIDEDSNPEPTEQAHAG